LLVTEVVVAVTGMRPPKLQLEEVSALLTVPKVLRVVGGYKAACSTNGR
jgi:hypothetical protein